MKACVVPLLSDFGEAVTQFAKARGMLTAAGTASRPDCRVVVDDNGYGSSIDRPKQGVAWAFNHSFFDGGSGTRLWPLSRKSFPKHCAAGRRPRACCSSRGARRGLAGIGRTARRHLRGSEEHGSDLGKHGGSGNQGTVVLEPAARNTAAAMALPRCPQARRTSSCCFCPPTITSPTSQLSSRWCKTQSPAAKPGNPRAFGVSPSSGTAYAISNAARRRERRLCRGPLHRKARARAGKGASAADRCTGTPASSSHRRHAARRTGTHAPYILKQCRLASSMRRSTASSCVQMQALRGLPLREHRLRSDGAARQGFGLPLPRHVERRRQLERGRRADRTRRRPEPHCRRRRRVGAPTPSSTHRTVRGGSGTKDLVKSRHARALLLRPHRRSNS